MFLFVFNVVVVVFWFFFWGGNANTNEKHSKTRRKIKNQPIILINYCKSSSIIIPKLFIQTDNTYQKLERKRHIRTYCKDYNSSKKNDE